MRAFELGERLEEAIKLHVMAAELSLVLPQTPGAAATGCRRGRRVPRV